MQPILWFLVLIFGVSIHSQAEVRGPMCAPPELLSQNNQRREARLQVRLLTHQHKEAVEDESKLEVEFKDARHRLAQMGGRAEGPSPELEEQRQITEEAEAKFIAAQEKTAHLKEEHKKKSEDLRMKEDVFAAHTERCLEAARLNAEQCNRVTAEMDSACAERLTVLREYVSRYGDGGTDESPQETLEFMGEAKRETSRTKAICEIAHDKAEQLCGSASQFVEEVVAVPAEEVKPAAQAAQVIQTEERRQTVVRTKVIPEMEQEIQTYTQLEAQAATVVQQSSAFDSATGVRVYSSPSVQSAGTSNPPQGRINTGGTTPPSGLSQEPLRTSDPLPSGGSPTVRTQTPTPTTTSDPQTASNPRSNISPVARSGSGPSPSPTVGATGSWPTAPRSLNSELPVAGKGSEQTEAAKRSDEFYQDSGGSKLSGSGSESEGEAKAAGSDAVNVASEAQAVPSAGDLALANAALGEAQAASSGGNLGDLPDRIAEASAAMSASGSSMGSAGVGGMGGGGGPLRLVRIQRGPSAIGEEGAESGAEGVVKAGQAGPDLREFLPGQRLAPVGMNQPSGRRQPDVHGPHVDMFKKISERFHVLKDTFEP